MRLISITKCNRFTKPLLFLPTNKKQLEIIIERKIIFIILSKIVGVLGEDRTSSAKILENNYKTLLTVQK